MPNKTNETISAEDKDFENKCLELGLTYPKVPVERIDRLMANVLFDVHIVPGTTTTIATAYLDIGFTLATEYSACADPRNFNADVGAEQAIKKASAAARDQLWKLEGYKLKSHIVEFVINAGMLTHEINNAYCKAIGDSTQLDWEIAPNNIKSSAFDGVLYTLNNPDTTPEQQHENWMKFKLQDGWVHGNVKCPNSKTHPCLLPYNDLPAAQRAKDHIFFAAVKTLQQLYGL